MTADLKSGYCRFPHLGLRRPTLRTIILNMFVDPALTCVWPVSAFQLYDFKRFFGAPG